MLDLVVLTLYLKVDPLAHSFFNLHHYTAAAIDTTEDKSLSRNTGVDVYSIGMLTYYVLTDSNPVPNQPQFEGFRDTAIRLIKRNYRFEWKCLPGFLADTILAATAKKQTDRISLDTLISNLRIASAMQTLHTITNTNTLLLLELSYRLDSRERVKISEFGRKIEIDLSELSKRITLATTSNRGRVQLIISIERYMSNADQRESLSKYFKGMCERAVSKVNKGLLSVTSVSSSNENILINLTADLPDSISLDTIDSLANNIHEVRSALDN